MEKLTVDGHELTLEQTYYIYEELIGNKVVATVEEAKDYIKHHKYEERKHEFVLKNPDINGIHFAFKKNNPHQLR